MAVTLIHEDGTKGTTMFDDGVKVYWAEGASEAVIITAVQCPVAGNAKPLVERVNAKGDHPILQRLKISELNYRRIMTIGEETEWRIMRNTHDRWYK